MPYLEIVLNHKQVFVTIRAIMEIMWMKPLGQYVLGSGHEIVFHFLVEQLLHLRLGE